MTRRRALRNALAAAIVAGSATLADGCSGGSPSAPAPPPPATVADRIRFRVEPGGVANYSGIGDVPSVQYYGCYEFINDGPGSAAISRTLTPIGPDGSVYPVIANIEKATTYGAGGNTLGCGVPTARDLDSVHPEAVRYRLRLDATFSDGLSGFIEKENVLEISKALPPKTKGIVVSEFRLRGSRGTDDQFVELQNVTSEPVTMAEWSIDLWSPNGNNLFTVARGFTATLGPGCHYLIGTSSRSAVSEGVRLDFKFSVPLNDSGGFALRDRVGRVIDQVGLNQSSVFREGQALTPLAGDFNRGYIRNGPDTDDNTRDFTVATSHPENSAVCTPAAGLRSLFTRP